MPHTRKPTPRLTKIPINSFAYYTDTIIATFITGLCRRSGYRLLLDAVAIQFALYTATAILLQRVMLFYIVSIRLFLLFAWFWIVSITSTFDSKIKHCFRSLHNCQ